MPSWSGCPTYDWVYGWIHDNRLQVTAELAVYGIPETVSAVHDEFIDVSSLLRSRTWTPDMINLEVSVFMYYFLISSFVLLYDAGYNVKVYRISVITSPPQTNK